MTACIMVGSTPRELDQVGAGRQRREHHVITIRRGIGRTSGNQAEAAATGQAVYARLSEAGSIDFEDERGGRPGVCGSACNQGCARFSRTFGHELDVVDDRKEEVLASGNPAGSLGAAGAVRAGQKPDIAGLPACAELARAIGDGASRPLEGEGPLPPAFGPLDLGNPRDGHPGCHRATHLRRGLVDPGKTGCEHDEE